MAMPLRLDVSNSPGCIGWPAVRAVGLDSFEPAKLQLSPVGTHEGQRASDGKRCLGDTLRAAARWRAREATARTASPRPAAKKMPSEQAVFRPPPGLPMPPMVPPEKKGARVADSRRAHPCLSRASSPCPTATPEPMSDAESASTCESEAGDAVWAAPGRGEAGPPGTFHVAAAAAPEGQCRGPPGVFHVAAKVALRAPPGNFFKPSYAR